MFWKKKYLVTFHVQETENSTARKETGRKSWRRNKKKNY